MAAAAETLLSLGWPGSDGAWRVEVPNRMAALAKLLREDGRADEAQALLDRIPKVEARDLVIRLTWNGDAMLDLMVDEPLGATAGHDNPRTVFGGALVKEATTKDHEAVYVCPRGFDGEYSARFRILYNDEKRPAQIAVVEAITHEGTADEKVTITKVSLAKPKTVKVALSGGRRTKVLPYEVPKTINTPRMVAPKADESKAKGEAAQSGKPGANRK